jgi:membrane fusion protein (multidrug efflux system)
VGLGLVLGVGGCASHAEVDHAEEGGAYPTTRPQRKDTEIVKEYVAQIRAIRHIEVRALERGYLQDIFVDEGKHVKVGAPMFQVMPLVYQAELQRASAEADFARIEFDNTTMLREGNVVSEKELALAKAKLAKAEAEKGVAQAHLTLTQFKAPFDGIMGRLMVRKGSLLEEGELLTTLADNSRMWVYFNVTEAEYLDYRKRMDEGHKPFEVKLRMANGEVFDQPGVVETIEADFNNETGNIAFRAGFPNPDGLLRHGETGNILVTSVKKDALLIPQKATFDILDKKYVYVVDEEGVAHLRPIQVSEQLPHLFVVSEGLTENDVFLLDGLRKVHDGGEVKTTYEEPADVLAHLDLPVK